MGHQQFLLAVLTDRISIDRMRLLFDLPLDSGLFSSIRSYHFR